MCENPLNSNPTITFYELSVGFLTCAKVCDRMVNEIYTEER